MVLKRSLPRQSFPVVWEWCKNVWYWNDLYRVNLSLWFENDVKTYGTETRSALLDRCFLFENDVKTYGTETHFSATFPSFKFENDVKTYGTETQIVTLKIYQAFENDVKMYGTETLQPIQYVPACLRMMWKCMVLKHRFDSYSIHWCLKMM